MHVVGSSAADVQLTSAWVSRLLSPRPLVLRWEEGLRFSWGDTGPTPVFPPHRLD